MKIAILGTTEHRSAAPFDDLAWEIWSQAQPDLPRWTRWFEIHDPEVIRRDYPPLWEWLTHLDGSKPVYMRRAMEEVPGSVAYPKDEITARFGRDFFTSTVAWEMALAITEIVAEREAKGLPKGAPDGSMIGIYGVDMAADGEYSDQRPGCLHFIDMARRLGIDVTMPAESELNRLGRVYGLEEDPPIVAKIAMRRALVTTRLAEIERQMRELSSEADQLRGAKAILDHAEHNWT